MEGGEGEEERASRRGEKRERVVNARNRERKIETEGCGEFRDRERNREGVHQKCRDREESLAREKEGESERESERELGRGRREGGERER